MSRSTSCATGLPYGLTRVCHAWGVARSSFYAERARRALQERATSASGLQQPDPPEVFPSDRASVGDLPSLPRLPTAATAAPQRSATEGEAAHSHAQTDTALAPGTASMARTNETDVVRSEHGGTLEASQGADSVSRPRGPKPKVSDAQVLEWVRKDLASSPFRGEGHRKVCARLRRAGRAVFARQVLRVMRRAQLLSPHRAAQGKERLHEGTIVTTAPDVMWGTDGLRVETVKDGWVWIFTAVEHWNGEVMGWHVSQKGDRFAALEPLKQGLMSTRGSVGRQVARGLSLRMDHGTQYTSEHFQNELKYWGITLSYGYVAQPETNGVVERFNRTLKEQVLRGQVFQDVAEVRAALGPFIERYNDSWMLEKNGFLSPREMRSFNKERLAA